ncbi:hypothetical protein [Synechocystis sp. CACIAM 05]|uniref:hypothetical protein n=1 Tax=Synechocystis sp. CACIAM 05 TaxID=1933929 RepID=UPI001390EBF4|nr:hypothetical protein [Synechocystis sp. CACIAM 05]
MADNVKPNGEKDHGLAPILNCWGICRELSNKKKALTANVRAFKHSKYSNIWHNCRNHN